MLHNVDLQPTGISNTPVMAYVREVFGIAAFFNRQDLFFTNILVKNHVIVFSVYLIVLHNVK